MSTIEQPEGFRLRDSVRVRACAGHVVVVDTASLAPALRLPLASIGALSALRRGIPAGGQGAVYKLAEKLASYGCLDGHQIAQPISRRLRKGQWYLPNPDPVFAAIGAVLRTVPAGVLLGVLGILLVAAVGAAGLHLAALAGGAADPGYAPLGVLLYFLVCVPLHELAHGVACRYAGAPVSGLGVQYGARLIPVPFINTKNLVLVAPRGLRILVCLAGPGFDILAAGFTAAALLSGWAGAAVWNTVFWCTLFFHLFNLNPFRTSDGSNALREFAVLPDGSAGPIARPVLVAFKAVFLLMLVLLLYQVNMLLHGYLTAAMPGLFQTGTT
jgi:hypothetical protein